ncbi:hypothetical protein GWI33_015555 [Rhynchophorus ferrugineus]|uniref:Mos1 transposase HTH domain-containing protein n=1 Tax=Rhynchophorus ferrugineus TaxID=354439 RepID=A0A834I492_RHYFE|nr:hypothetical protein GWI33_015555 [Rhynchophorus ferrugineus]
MDKKEFRVLLKYCFLKGKNSIEAKTWLDAEFPDTVPGKSTIKDWHAKRHLMPRQYYGPELIPNPIAMSIAKPGSIPKGRAGVRSVVSVDV